MSWIFLGLGIALFTAVAAAYYPIGRHVALAGWTFVLGLILIEFAHWYALWTALAIAAFIWAGAVSTLPGQIGLVLWVASLVLMLARTWRSRRDGARIESEILQVFEGEEDTSAQRPRAALGALAWALPRKPAEVIRVKDLPFAQHGRLTLTLDLFRREDEPEGCPILLQIHGGGWVIGDKAHQGLPMMHHLARRGWLCATANYRLSPRATFPEHLIDVKRAIAWLKAHAHEHGGDPDQIYITGNSAGGHLASLAALTPQVRAYQPGFEEADTSVQGCVALYGVYDFTNREGQWPHKGLERLLTRQVLKADRSEHPELYEAASPTSQVGPHAPPFLIIHGKIDTLVPVAEARLFAERLKASTEAPVVYAELPEAQHAFDLVPSVRTQGVVWAIEAFLERVRGARTHDRS